MITTNKNQCFPIINLLGPQWSLYFTLAIIKQLEGEILQASSRASLAETILSINLEAHFNMNDAWEIIQTLAKKYDKQLAPEAV